MFNKLLILKCLLFYVWISSGIFAVTNYLEGDYFIVGIHISLFVYSAWLINDISNKMKDEDNS